MHILYVGVPDDHQSCVEVLSVKYFLGKVAVTSIYVDDKRSLILVKGNRVERRAPVLREAAEYGPVN